MKTPSPEEEAIRAALSRGEGESALRLTLSAYSAELYGFLFAELKDDTRAEDVFALFVEDLWKGTRSLTLRTTMRAYCYVVARHALYRYLDSVVRKQQRQVPLSQADLGLLVQRARTGTHEFLRTETRDRLTALRESLPEEERTLLVLRIDRGLSFREIAEVLQQEEEGGEDLKLLEARVRKRFQLLKDKLREAALAAGIVEKKS